MFLKKNINSKMFFYVITIFSAVISVILLLSNRGLSLNSYVFLQGNNMFMDFFNHISYSENLSQTYYLTEHACFPPLAYLFYFFLNRMLPQGSTVMFRTELTAPYAVLVYVLYVVLLSIAMFYCIRKVLPKISDEESFLLTFLIVLSNVFIFGVVERGNSVFIVLILLILAIKLRDSNNKILREAALILIAIATGFKIYPAIFGVLYLIEKRNKECYRLFFYGIIFFFVPFLFLGGFPAVVRFTLNQFYVQISNYADYNIIALCKLIGNLFFGSANDFSFIAFAITIFYLACTVFVLFYSNQAKWKNFMLLCSIMIIVPSWSGDYVAIFMVLPLLYFFKELNYSYLKTEDCIFATLFGLIFLMFVWNIDILKDNGYNLGSLLRYLAIYMFNIMILTTGIISSFKTIKFKKSQENEN